MRAFLAKQTFSFAGKQHTLSDVAIDNTARTTINRFKARQKALMQQLLTGKRRVKVKQTNLKAN